MAGYTHQFLHTKYLIHYFFNFGICSKYFFLACLKRVNFERICEAYVYEQYYLYINTQINENTFPNVSCDCFKTSEKVFCSFSSVVFLLLRKVLSLKKGHILYLEKTSYTS